MAFEPQQIDIDILKSGNIQKYFKLEILNRSYKIQDVITGNLVSDSFTIDAESDIRRAYSCDLVVTDSSFYVGSDTKIWMDKIVRPYLGIVYERTGEIRWYLIGTFCLGDSDYSYSTEEHLLVLSCNDLMCTLNGDCGGHIEGYSFTIEEGNDIRTVFIDLFEQAGIEKYRVCDMPYTIPYDLEFNANVTWYEIFKEIIDLYPEYEIFFDVDGVLVIDRIPTCEDDELYLENEIFKQFVVSENGLTTSFSEIYNHIQVWGQTIEVDGFSDSSTYSNQTYATTISSVSELGNFKVYGVSISSECGDGARLKINSFAAKPIMIDENRPITANYISSGDYAFKYRKATDDFLLLGQYQVFGEAYDSNPDSPYNIANLGYELLYVCEGNDYDKIYTDDLANQRARYEIYLHTNLQQQLALNMVLIPWIEVNKKIEYKSESTTEILPYIIKSISGSTSEATMSVSLVRFYPEYPDYFRV